MEVSMSLRICVAAALAALILAAGPAAAQRQSVRGDVVRADATSLTVRAGDGTTTLKLPAELRVTARLPADWSAIGPNSYVGTTAVPQADGTLLAKEVHIFAEAQRGSGEGHYPMATPGDTMTNATVSKMSGGAPARDTMTNATVAAANQSGGARRMTLTYKGGEQTVVVPDGVPIMRSEPGDRSLLVPGAHVVAYAHRDTDGAMLVERLSVGKNGYTPPS
jgi:hypothetical protein